MKIFLFRRPTPKQFEYKPLYYDARKEELEKIQERYTNPEKAMKKEAVRDRINMRWDIHRKHKGKEKSSNHTLILYILLVAAIVYLLFFAKVF